jgi:hypothetical protein
MSGGGPPALVQGERENAIRPLGNTPHPPTRPTRPLQTKLLTARLLEAVDLCQQRGQQPQPRIWRASAAAVAAAVRPAGCERVRLVQEDDGRRGQARTAKRVAQHALALAHKHAVQLRAGQRDERRAAASGRRAREHRLAAAWRAVQQHAARRREAEARKRAGVLQRPLDRLLQAALDALIAADVCPADGAHLHRRAAHDRRAHARQRGSKVARAHQARMLRGACRRRCCCRCSRLHAAAA